MSELFCDERIGIAGQRKAPGYGHCERCKTPWKFVDGHVTSIGTNGKGVFPLCEACWRETDIATRLVYYQSAFVRLGWLGSWTEIEQAVRAEDVDTDAEEGST
jgi:hypothetical protein